jgi:hypothetical protein
VAVRDAEGRLSLTEREPFRLRDGSRGLRHTVVEGETLAHIAGRYYDAVPRGCGLWWAVADANELVDPTTRLRPGAILLVPPLDDVLAWVGRGPGGAVERG